MIDAQWLLDVARYGHILVVAIGFGTAFLADYLLLSRLTRPVDEATLSVLHLCHAVIWKAILGMWITGILLVGLRTGFVPANFTPKLIAKIGTVALLTGNAVLIGQIAMPLIRAAQGRSLLWLPTGRRATLAVVGAVSSASWLLALAMGSSKVLAASPAVVFVFLVPLGYAAAITLALAIMFSGQQGTRPGPRRAATATPVAHAFPAE